MSYSALILHRWALINIRGVKDRYTTGIVSGFCGLQWNTLLVANFFKLSFKKI